MPLAQRFAGLPVAVCLLVGTTAHLAAQPPGRPPVRLVPTGRAAASGGGQVRPSDITGQQPSAAAQPAAPVRRHRLRLTREQSLQLERVLSAWEEESGRVKTYRCPFQRWDYDPIFGPGPNIPKTKAHGEVKYSKPDKGSFEIEKVLHYQADGQGGAGWKEHAGEVGEHWVCDGEALYELDARKKQLIVRPLPEAMQGQAIGDGPLPFLFGAEKEKLLKRYDMRVSQETKSEIWLEAYPLWAQDAANYQRVELILDREQLLPSAIQVYSPNDKGRTVYIFDLNQAKVNDPIDRLLGFRAPRTPLGWKKITEQLAPPVTQNPQSRPQPPRQNSQPADPQAYRRLPPGGRTLRR